MSDPTAPAGPPERNAHVVSEAGGAEAPGGLAGGGASALADGQWHRMHPLTPLMRGGLVLLIVFGFIFANLRDRLIALAINIFAGGRGDVESYSGGDPVEWVLENNLAVTAALVTLGALVLICVGFWVVWRFQEFRVSDDSVEIRRGILFRSHRRAPLDRVQGVNLTRPFPSRLLGMAKLEVVGAGSDANVPLEYLATRRAETVREDILRLASGARHAREAQRAQREGRLASRRDAVVDSVSGGVTDLIGGVDTADVPPHLVLRVPTGRLVGSQLLSVVTPIVFILAIYGIFLGIIIPIITGSAGDSSGIAIVGLTAGTAIPIAIVLIAITWGTISKNLRYSIAPTRDGVRVTFGLLTTVTETLPPGRVFAIEVVQPMLWRPFGWWFIRINRMSGKSETADASSQNQQFTTVLPVGTQEDVDRVLGMFMPDIPMSDQQLLWSDGMHGPRENDPFCVMPPRARWRRPLSGKRHGYLITAYALLMRRGRFPRKLALFPMARLQGISIAQGPIDRAQRVAWGQAHSIRGPIHGMVVGLEREDALTLMQGTSAGIVQATREDATHRWGSGQGEDASATSGGVAPMTPTVEAAPAPDGPSTQP